MCLAPSILNDGTQVACRECWQCRQDRVNNWVGRCIAETRTAVAAHAVTLTYGRDDNVESETYGEAMHEKAAVLTYSDVQKFIKLLRKHGFPARYFVAGEYGSRKGRAHWHIILFWQEKVPPGIVLQKNWWFARLDPKTGKQAVLQNGKPAWFWPHGHTFWESPTMEHFRYNTKYVLKQVGAGADEAQGKQVGSKEPPLGAPYFAQLARRYAEQSLAPQDATYSFPEAVRKNGERIAFRLAGASKDRFIAAYVDAWRALHGDKEMPASEMVEKWVEKGWTKPLTREELRLRRSLYRPVRELNETDRHKLAAIVRRDAGRQLSEAEWLGLVGGSEVKWDEVLSTFVYKLDGKRWLWRLNSEGFMEWQESAKHARSIDRPSQKARRVKRPG